jgi:hypothetical protein
VSVLSAEAIQLGSDDVPNLRIMDDIPPARAAPARVGRAAAPKASAYLELSEDDE